MYSVHIRRYSGKKYRQIQSDTCRYALPVEVHICMYLVHNTAYHQVVWNKIQADTGRYMQICTPLKVHICMYLPVLLIHVHNIRSDMHKIHLWEFFDTYRYMQRQLNTCMYVSDMHSAYPICT